MVEDVVFRKERERQRIQEEEERQEQERLRLIKEQEEEARKADVILFLENFLEGIKMAGSKTKRKTTPPILVKYGATFLVS